MSNQSGFIVIGHARLEAALVNGYKKAPVSYKDFDDEAQEYAQMTSDNEIARWPQLDFQYFKIESEKFDIDKDFFGVQNLNFEEKEKSDKNKEIDIEELGGSLNCIYPRCGFEFEKK